MRIIYFYNIIKIINKSLYLTKYKIKLGNINLRLNNIPSLFSESMSKLQVPLSKNEVKQMFDQVTINLNHLLDTLTYIYNSHGVEYVIYHYFDTLMRLLTPIQLLSQYKLTKISVKKFISSKNIKQNEFHKKRNQFQSNDQINLNFGGRKQQIQTKKEIKQKIIKYINSNINADNVKDIQQIVIDKSQSYDEQSNNQRKIKNQKKQRSQQQDNDKHKERKNKQLIMSLIPQKNKRTQIKNEYNMNDKQQNQKKDGSSRKPVEKQKMKKTYSLSEQQELVLCKWISDQVRMGIILTKKAIQKQANCISKDNLFEARSGWFRRFLYRHPGIGQKLSTQKRLNQYLDQSQQYIHYEGKENQKMRQSHHKRGSFNKWGGKGVNKVKRYINKSEIIDLSESESFEQIKTYRRIENNDSHSKSGEQNSDGDGSLGQQKMISQRGTIKNKLDEQIELYQVLDRLENAVKGHKSQMLFWKGPENKNNQQQ